MPCHSVHSPSFLCACVWTTSMIVLCISPPHVDRMRHLWIGSVRALFLVSPPVTAVRQSVASSVLRLTQSPDGDASSTAEVDLFMSTQRIKVLNADTQV